MNKWTIRCAVVVAALCAVPSVSRAEGDRVFCARWQYQYTDTAEGEDYLLHNMFFGLWGEIDASHSFAYVLRDGLIYWFGYLDESGCSPPLSGLSGTYEFGVYPVLASGSSEVWVYPDFNMDFRFFANTFFQLSVPDGATDVETRSVGLGDPVANVAAVSTLMLTRPDNGHDGFFAIVYADRDEQVGQANMGNDGAVIQLGVDGFGSKLATRKSIIAHELGHAAMFESFGSGNVDYGDPIPPGVDPLCECGHVNVSAPFHCLQSKEFIGAAIAEGWAHFYAAHLFNNPSQSNASFAYYKEFLHRGIFFNWVEAPPIRVDVYDDPPWMANECSGSHTGRGVEYDWLTYLYAVKHKTPNAYTFADFQSVFLKACGDSDCDPDLHFWTWNMLKEAANDAHGPGSPKAEHWEDLGGQHRVDF